MGKLKPGYRLEIRAGNNEKKQTSRPRKRIRKRANRTRADGEDNAPTTPKSAERSLDFIPFVVSSPSTTASSGSESLSEDERVHANEMISMKLLSDLNISEGLDLRNSMRAIWDPQPSTPKNTGPKGLRAPRETPGYEENMADDESSESSIGPSSPWVIRPLGERVPEFVKELQKGIRFCVFNVGNVSRPDFWKIIKERLSKEILAGVQRIESVTQPNRNKRIDIWVMASVASRLKSALYLTANARRNGTAINYKFPLRSLDGVWKPNGQTNSWRIDVYRTWRDRQQCYKAPRVERFEAPRKGIMTFNVNGLLNKRREFDNMLHIKEVGIIAIQETLYDTSKHHLYIPGYEVYQRSKSKTFRGQALAVHKSYTSYEVGSRDEDFMIHIKVVGVTAGAPWHIIAVYLPSGGNTRTPRTRCIKKLLKEYKSVIDKDPKAKVLIMGDFNVSRDTLPKKLRVEKSGLKILKISGNGKTFHRKSTQWSELDTIVTSPEAEPLVITAKVMRRWGEIEVDSDHFPLVTRFRAETDMIQTAAPVKTRFNADRIKGHGKMLVTSNRWALLPLDPISSHEELDKATQDFTDTINVEGLESGIKEAVTGKTFTYDRVLKRRVKKVALARKRWYAARRRNDADADKLKEQYEQKRKSVRQKIEDKESKLHAKRIKRVIELYRDHEMKGFHRWESEHTINGVSSATDKATPVKDKNGKLLTNKKDILERTNEYYKELLQDDPEKLSRDKSFWENKSKTRRVEALSCNDPITWKDVLLAIRAMALGTSPGSDDIPIELYKSMLKEECHKHLRNMKVRVGDATYVALPADKLPETPCTPMGRQLERIITGMWNTASQPNGWSKVTNVSLYKSGDPTDLHNYRGISLIAVGMKIFTAVLALRISRIAELNDLFVTEQGGFRTGEEAVAQFIALAEIVRRRRLINKKTWIVFIDFKKAFDKVMHEALFEKMDAMGFRGHFLEVIRNIYKTSSACTRVGGEYGEAYDMLRGTRQGCPLSPILFLIFINDFLSYVPKGVEVPCMKVGPKNCPGLLFADDVAGLMENEEETRAFLTGVTAWSKTWHMPMGAPKCGVMLVGGDEQEQKRLSEEYFEVDGQKVNVVRIYKYLGINITDKLGDREATDEYAHCKVLAQKVKMATDMRRVFLRNKAYPLELKVAVINSKIASVGCYGGEWVGMCQDRTGIIQKELNVAMKIALGSSTKSQLHGSKIMSIELGVPTIEQRMTDMRIRLWQKAPSMKSWIKYLVDPENRFKCDIRGIKVWSSNTQHILKRMQPFWDERNGVFAEPPAERQAVNNRVYEMMSNNKKYDFLEEPITKYNRENPRRQKQEARATVISRSLYSDMYVKVVAATVDYMSFGFDRTRRFLHAAVYTPSLTEGTVWLVRLRTNAWWTTNKRYHALTRTGAKNHLRLNMCPCCGGRLRVNEPEYVHIILDCPAWKKPRDDYIGDTIAYFWSRESWSDIRRMDAKHMRLEIVSRILGASVLEGDYLPKYKASNRVVDLDWNWREGAPNALDAFTRGWGGVGEVHIPGMNAHGYTTIAKFLAIVMPQHKLKLFPVGRGSDENKAYDTTTDEESPVKRRKPRLTAKSSEVNGEGAVEMEDQHLELSSFYPLGSLTSAIQADAAIGMGTRCIHAFPPKEPDVLGWVYSDEEDYYEQDCVDNCVPRPMLSIPRQAL